MAGIAAIAARRRVAEGEAREQLRLLERAAAVVALAFIACTVGSFLAPTAFDVGAIAALMSLSVLAAAMAVAILRHRLYGLDVYVDRALVLSGTTRRARQPYVGAVVLAGRLLGQDVRLGVALPATAWWRSRSPAARPAAAQRQPAAARAARRALRRDVAARSPAR